MRMADYPEEDVDVDYPEEDDWTKIDSLDYAHAVHYHSAKHQHAGPQDKRLINSLGTNQRTNLFQDSNPWVLRLW